MINDKEHMNQYGYFAKDVAADLSVTSSTLRRWSLELEKHGYIFERNEKEQRIYFERDFKTFRELKRLLSNSVPFIDAIKAVATTKTDEKSATRTQGVFFDRRLSEQQFREIINEEVQAAMAEEREMMFRAFEQKLDNIIERRDRSLMHEIRKDREKQLLETAATFETPKSAEKKSFWRRIFYK
ncbi:MerR family transcriptional regulator [Bacillus haynesii]|uniref:MerR family transcriptional regulator n=1 Tax=Bacillus TaxID=1386 RepID=UPI002281D6B8|nr:MULTISPECIES: MerR family transcriptional regulator [Bacillus]MCY7773485.1 MerR family transcriptional regulator [Bacillus licheniformis]MCY7780143.1 MerR family transcriptional regulator [Bacillus haynesii]MCY8021497.1 MerR family transcriptional regulator [Bacillus licheniformis]MCY8530082.1 MerR family transcriptional regulator [Bacillus licheniformis]MCY9266933.1 MerR family transcriptional regulator [Bacillus licheniformis]